MPNASEANYEQAIIALQQYQKKLLEVSDTMQSAVNQTDRNLQGDDNIRAINQTLQKRIIKIHEASLIAKQIALQLSLELEEIKKGQKKIYDND